MEAVDEFAEYAVAERDRLIDVALCRGADNFRVLLSAETHRFASHRRRVQPALYHRFVDLEVKLQPVDVVAEPKGLIPAVR